MSDFENEINQELLTISNKLGKSSEETTKTAQKIKEINVSLVDITKNQYDVVNRASSDGERIKTMLSESVNRVCSISQGHAE